jgi:hypothetical protein
VEGGSTNKADSINAKIGNFAFNLTPLSSLRLIVQLSVKVSFTRSNSVMEKYLTPNSDWGEMLINTEFDVRTDSNGHDPDSASPTLRSFHQQLWSKPLPSGALFNLERMPGGYLTHNSQLGDFKLSSDTISNSLRGSKRRASLISQIPSVSLDAFQALGSTIGARILFPGNRVDGKPTINVARGFNAQIADRFDLTLECIRLHYLRQASPLAATLDRYADFFGLFGSFEGYVDFFLLGDLVQNGQVKFCLPFDGEFGQALPNTVDEYNEYMANTTGFVAARNRRIEAWAAKN